MDFRDQLAAFHAPAMAPDIQGLIILGTRQPITAALLIGGLPAARVAFLLTDETRTMPNQIAELLTCSPDAWFCPDGDHATTLRVYEGVKAVLEQWKDLDRARIAADVTGGLKPMSVGLEKAAHLLGLTTVYIESTWGLGADGKSAPIPGSQRLVIPPNPYTVFGDLEAAEARRLAAAHDYAGAHRLFATLAERVPDRPDFEALAHLTAAYAAWDAFDAPGALAQLMRVVSSSLPPDLADMQTMLDAQRAVLKQLADDNVQLSERRSPELAYLQQVDRVLPLLGSLHANARRREAQGRYDVAALLRYRCLELFSQQRLATYSLLTDAPNYSEVLRSTSGLPAAYERIERSQVPRGRPRGMPGHRDYAKITLFNGYMLLAALEDQLVVDCDIRQIRERSEARNRSALAHGFRPITLQEYEPFRRIVENLLDQFFLVIKQNRAAWEDTYRFIAI